MLSGLYGTPSCRGGPCSVLLRLGDTLTAAQPRGRNPGFKKGAIKQRSRGGEEFGRKKKKTSRAKSVDSLQDELHREGRKRGALTHLLFVAEVDGLESLPGYTPGQMLRDAVEKKPNTEASARSARSPESVRVEL